MIAIVSHFCVDPTCIAFNFHVVFMCLPTSLRSKTKTPNFKEIWLEGKKALEAGRSGIEVKD